METEKKRKSVSYFPHMSGLTDEQCERLLKGEKVMLKPTHLMGKRPMALLEHHWKKWEKMHNAGKGFGFSISKTHAKWLGTRFHKLHPDMEGVGIWSELWNKIKGIGKKIVDNPITRGIVGVAKNLPVVKQGLDTVEGTLNSVAPSLKIGSKARGVLDKYAGSGVKKGKAKKGGSFLL